MSFHSSVLIPRMRGLEMIDPSSAVIDKKIFLPLSKSQPNLDMLSYKKKRALSKAQLKQKESYWSNDFHIQYVPFSKDYFIPPIQQQSKKEFTNKNISSIELDTSKIQKRSKSTSNKEQGLKSQKSKKRIIINLDDRFTTKTRPSFRSPHQLSTTNTSDSAKMDNEHKIEAEHYQRKSENNLKEEGQQQESQYRIEVEDEKKNSQNQSTIDNSNVRFIESSSHHHSQNSLSKPKSSHRDVLEISKMYLKDSKDLQAIAERVKMFEDIRKGNAKRAKIQEQMRLENLKKVMTQKPVFLGREFYYKQAKTTHSFEQVVTEEDPNQFYTANGYKKDKMPLKSAMTIGTQQKSMQKQINYSKIKRFRIAVRRYKIVTCFWKSIDEAIMKKRQIKLDTFSVNLKDSIQNCMKFTLQAGQQSFIKLFKDTENLAYYTHAVGKQMYNEKRAKIRQHCLNIMQEIASKSSKVEKEFSFIKLIAKNSNNYEFPPQNFWPAFIIKRVEFTKIGSLKNITPNQKEMITLLFFIVYGLFNRLVRPWTTLKLEQSDELAKNSQMTLSIIFYIMHDYLKEKNPIIQNNLNKVDSKYYLQERDVPLNAYPELLSNESEIHQKQSGDSDKAKIKLQQQVIDNDNIIIGISSRKKVEDLVNKDLEFISTMRQCLAQIANNILAKSEEIYPELKDKLLNLI